MSRDSNEPIQIPSKESLLEEIQRKRKVNGISELELGREINLTQSQVSKLLSGNRRLLYDEAHQIMTYLASRFSSIPRNIAVTDLMISSNSIAWASTKDLVRDVAKNMYEIGFQEVLVQSDGDYVGVVTRTSLLHGFLFPPENQRTETWITKYPGFTLDEAGFLENIPEYSEETPLSTIFQVLMDENAVILKKRQEITGVITRKELLQLIL